VPSSGKLGEGAKYKVTSGGRKGYKVDFKSKDLASVDLFDGERQPDQYEYDKIRQKVLTEKPKIVDNRTPEQKTAMLKDLSKQDLHEYEKLMKNHKLNRAGYHPGSGEAQVSAVKAKRSFIDTKGRRIDMIYTERGGISLQFYFLDSDRLGMMYDAICKKFGNNGLLPARYKREINIVSPLKSVCVFLPPQQFELGFKTELIRKLEELVK